MVGKAFCQPALFGAFYPCADIEENCLGVLNGSFVPREDSDPYAVLLLEMVVQPQSLRDRGPINCIPTPVKNVDAWQPQKDTTGVVSGVPNNAHHKCCTFDSALNEIIV